jgi:hypothetical protein
VKGNYTALVPRGIAEAGCCKRPAWAGSAKMRCRFLLDKIPYLRIQDDLCSYEPFILWIDSCR